MTPRRARISGDLYHQQVPEGAVPVTRGRGPWGNPYKVGPGRSAAGVVALYRAYLAARPELVARARVELAGRDLAC